MKVKYRVKGIVESSFILRGAYFGINDNIDFCIMEKELEFVKDHCKVQELIDLDKAIETPSPVLEEKQIEDKPKGEKNELQRKSTNNASKNKHKAKILLVE